MARRARAPDPERAPSLSPIAQGLMPLSSPENGYGGSEGYRDLEGNMGDGAAVRRTRLNRGAKEDAVVHQHRGPLEEVAENDIEEDDGNEDTTMSGDFVLSPGPLCTIGAFNVSEEEEEEEDINLSGQFVLHRAPLSRPHSQATTAFGDLGRALEPERGTRESSEASTIRLNNPPTAISGMRPRAGERYQARSDAPSPSTGRPPFSAFPHTSATAGLRPLTAGLPPNSALPSSLQEWRYRDVPLPDPLPQTVGQWAVLEHKVRMITPLPNVTKPHIVRAGVKVGVRSECKRRFEEMIVKEQKRVCEVVRKSWVDEDGVDFLTGNEKKSHQIHWENLSAQCIRNVRAIIEHIEYENFDKEIEEVNEWKTPDEGFEIKGVKADNSFFGIEWELRGSRGRFDDGEEGKEWSEEYMMDWHDKVWPKRPEADPLLVLQDGEDGEKVRMTLAESEEGVKLKGAAGKKKKRAAAKPKLGQANKGVLRGGDPGPWNFWTEPEEKHLRDVVLSVQGDAFGA